MVRANALLAATLFIIKQCRHTRCDMGECKYCHGRGGIYDSLIPDPRAGFLVSWLDAEDYWEAWQRVGRGESLGDLMEPCCYEQEVYQCPECGRLLIGDPRRPFYFLFEPSGAGNQRVICPASGGKNGDSLYGSFSSRPNGRLSGNYIYWDYGEDVEYEHFDTFEELHSRFKEKVRRLRDANQLGWAELEKDGEIIFSWSRNED